MPQSRLVKLVREIQDIGGSWLNIGGGEPGVVFERTLAVVAAADSRSETWLNTTGFALDNDKARRLKEAGLFGGRVSIHSHKPAEHDAFVGYRGAFKIAADAIQTFRRVDIFPVLSAAMPEQRITWDGVQDMMQIGKDLGAGFVEIIPIRPAGRAIVACSHSELRRHNVNRRMFKTFNTDPRFADYPAVNSPAYLETPDRFGCIAGTERLYISASGDVQPCPLVNLSIGNVLDEPLASICRRMRSLLPVPRSDLLCSQLGPLVSKYVAEGGQGCTVLPIPPDKSTKILASLPASPTPKAWAL
jgi:MoaA/NifB/PqqE/SkfB family radical SAM enzyme